MQHGKRRFQLIQDYYSTGKKLYAQKSVTIRTGLTVIVGRNGSGKTTLLKQIREQLDKKSIEYSFFDNLTHGGEYARKEAGYNGDMDFLAAGLLSSEGQNIFLNLSKFAQKIGRYVKDMVGKNQKELWFILDAVDSGLSIDNIVSLKENLVDVIFETNQDRAVYFLITANEYELARGENCLDASSCKYRKFDGYEEYRDFILGKAEKKER